MKKIFLIILLSIVSFSVFSQKKKNNEKSNLESLSISGLKWRSVGPALTSGRISDIAVNPNKPFEYYVAVASGGVWKTQNWGVSFEPIFDNESSYSIGCVSVDPENPNVVWVGTCLSSFVICKF